MTEQALYDQLSQLLSKDAQVLKHLTQIKKRQEKPESKSWYKTKGRDIETMMVLDAQCEYCSYRDLYNQCEKIELIEAQKTIQNILSGIVINSVNQGYGYTALKHKLTLIEEMITLKNENVLLPDLYPNLSFDTYNKDNILNPVT